MENVISNLVKRFERGSLTRRELVQSLAMLLAASRSASAAGFQCSGVDHVSIGVSNLQKSAAFYQTAFGLPVLNQPGADTLRLKVGSGYLVLRQGMNPGRVDHFAFGVTNFNKDAVTQDLKQRGMIPQEDRITGFYVKDPDGFPVQLISDDPQLNEGHRVSNRG
jgi:catechol 2,3-dioxygenase-like lactoylglutathione lyase family enzyme